MRIELTSAFTTLAVSEGTLQNVSRLAQIEVSSTQTENTGIVLNPGDILQFKSDVTLYARAVWKNAEPTEKVFLAHEPFKGKGEGGDNVLTYKGSVETYEDLPSTHNVGDVYNIETADETHGILAGDNVAWNGTSWDRLAGIYAIMQGATSSANGKAGLAPAPLAGDDTKVLFGDGTYKDISQVPLGTILPYSANAQTPPYGFLYCEGQAISRTMYPDLFALIGTTYGAGDGSTTFNLPNMLDRTLTVRWIIKAYDAPTPSSAQIDLSQYASDLANKAYRNLQNVTNVAYRRRPRKAFTLADLIAAVQTGNYNEYDICPGDYYVGASGYTYIFAGDNPLKGTYTDYPITADHAGLIVNTHTTTKWNNANDTTGGYVSSVLHSYLVNTVLPKVKTDLGGVSHLCAHKKLYSNAITAEIYNRIGTNSGASSSWAWSDNQYIAALSEVQVYGSIVWSSSGYDTGEADQQLEVCRSFKHTEIFGDEYPWLRDVVSSSRAAHANANGNATRSGASSAYYAAGLICFH